MNITSLEGSYWANESIDQPKAIDSVKEKALERAKRLLEHLAPNTPSPKDLATHYTVSKETNELLETPTASFPQKLPYIRQLRPSPVKAESATVDKPEALKECNHPSVLMKSAGFWKCVGRELDKASGGFIYLFEATPECKALDELARQQHCDMVNKNLYPAVQLEHKYFSNLAELPFFHFLGYQATDDLIKIPDTTVLNTRWPRLRKTNPDLQLPLIRFVPVPGIISNRDFIQFFLEDKWPVAEGDEFIHDNTVHNLPGIILIDECNKLDQAIFKPKGTTYKESMSLFKSKIKAFQTILDQLQDAIQNNPSLAGEEKKRMRALADMLRTYVAILVDIGRSKAHPATFQALLLRLDLVPLPWDDYMRKTFGDQYTANKNDLTEAWKVLSRNYEAPVKDLVAYLLQKFGMKSRL